MKTIQKIIISILLLSGFLFVGSSDVSSNGYYGDELTCKPTEYACWGRSVPIKDIKCDEVYEREVCDNDLCGDDCCPDDDPLTLDIDEGDCTCCCTQYTCRLCEQGTIYYYPERPEGEHGDADKCPTEDDSGQHDGTGNMDDEKDGYPWFAYDRGYVLNVQPIQFGIVEDPPTPTPTIPTTPTPDVTVEPTIPEPSVTTVAQATPTPGGPSPTIGPSPTPTTIPTRTPTPSGVAPTPLPNAPCGWPIGPNTGTAEGNYRRITGPCMPVGDEETGDYPTDGSLIYSSGHKYPAIDVGTGKLGENQPTVQTTHTGTAYFCVEHNTQFTPPSGLSYGVYVMVEGDTFSTIYGHLDANLVPGFSGTVPQPGDSGCEPSDKCYEPNHCLVGEANVSAGDAIGTVGLTGATNGHHLHYEVWNSPSIDEANSARVCPADFMDYTAEACGGVPETAFDFIQSIFVGLWQKISSLVVAINPFSNHTELVINIQ